MAEMQEQYDYSALNQSINKKFDFGRLKDLRQVAKTRATFDANISPTENIRAVLRFAVYPDDEQLAHHHSFDIFQAIHEQAMTAGMAGGFNDVAALLRKECAAMEMGEGKICFLRADESVIGEYETVSAASRETFGEASSATTEVPAERESEVHEAARSQLRDVLPEFPTGKLAVPDFSSNDFRLPLEAFRSSGKASEFIDPSTKTNEFLCARYVTAVLRRYLGPEFVQRAGLENKNAWELRHAFEQSGTGEVRYTMNKFYVFRGERPLVSFVVNDNGKTRRVEGDKAKETPYYGFLYRKFYREAVKTSSPPSLLTFFYQGTHYSHEIVRSFRQDGTRALNSHVVVNLGKSKKRLKTGSFRSEADVKKVDDVLTANFPHRGGKFEWAFLDGEADAKESRSRLYLNGQQLLYKKGKFLDSRGNEAEVRAGDTLEWEDVFVMDTLGHHNRVVGLTELVMTGKYDFMDVIATKPEQVSEAIQTSPDPMPFPVRDLFQIRKRETVEQVLAARGIPSAELVYHRYAYERIGLNVRRLRPFDAIPLFDTADIAREVMAKGGLFAAFAEVRGRDAAKFEAKHPGDHLFVISPKEKPPVFVRKIFAMPEFTPLGNLSIEEKRIILTAIGAANKGFYLELTENGEVQRVHEYAAAAPVYIPQSLVAAIITKIARERQKNAVYIPDVLPGGKRLLAPEFDEKEKLVIERASWNPNVRTALALILTMEQKQQDDLFGRKSKKLIGSILGSVIPSFRPNSLGMFQIRIQRSDLERTGKDFETLRAEVLANPEVNAELAVHRVEEIMRRAPYVFRQNGEEFDPETPGGMAYILSCYHAGEGKVLTTTLNVWVDLMEEQLGSLADVKTRYPSSVGVQRRFEALAEFLSDRGEIDLSEGAITEGTGFARKEKVRFLGSTMMAALRKWYYEKTGENLSLAVAPEIVDRPDIKTTYLSYGVRATRYGTMESISAYSVARRQEQSSDAVAAL